MAKLALVVLALSVFTAQCAVLRSQDAHERIKRSPCEVCGHNYGPPGPPPRIFHARHWTGYARNADGSQEGVFSGAAAEARGDTQASGQAFSVAASEAGTDSGDLSQKQGSLNQGSLTLGTSGGYGSNSNHGTYNSNYKESNFAYHSGGGDKHSGLAGSNGGFGENQQQVQSGGYKSTGYGGSYGNVQGNEQQAQSGGYKSQGGFESNQQQVQTGGYKSAGGIDSNLQQDQELNAAFQSQAQNSAGSGTGYGGRGDQGQVEQFGKYSSGSSSGSRYGAAAQSGAQSGVGSGSQGYKQGQSGSIFGHDEQQQVQSSGSGHFDSGNYGSGAGSSSVGAGTETGAGFGVNTNLGSSRQVGAQESAHSALGGALKLASDGLQTAQQAGCNTCGKSSYALSNAKSHSGSAIALSIGG